MRFSDYIKQTELDESLWDYLAIKNDNPWWYAAPAGIGLGMAAIGGLEKAAKYGWDRITGKHARDQKAAAEYQQQLQQRQQQRQAELAPQLEKAKQILYQVANERGWNNASLKVKLNDIAKHHPELSAPLEQWIAQTKPPERDPLA